MVAKEDKDGQIKLLREALEKILNSAEYVDDWGENTMADDIAKIAQTALFDTTY